MSSVFSQFLLSFMLHPNDIRDALLVEEVPDRRDKPKQSNAPKGAKSRSMSYVIPPIEF